jgi:hypothetical protein
VTSYGKAYFAGAGLITGAVALENGQAGIVTFGVFLIIYAIVRAIADL